MSVVILDSVIEPDRGWCSEPDAARPDRSTRPLWRVLDRWSMSGAAVVTAGCAEVDRVIRLPSGDVRSALARWTPLERTLVGGTLSVERVSAARLGGVFTRSRRRPLVTAIDFEHWSADHLCAHLRPAGPSAGRGGSPHWWALAHATLDLVNDQVARLAADAAGRRPV